MVHFCRAYWCSFGSHSTLPDTMLEDAVTVAEKVTNKIQSIKDFKCTISAGVTQIKEGDALETLLERLDKALYETKSKGKRVQLLLNNSYYYKVLKPGLLCSNAS